MSTPVTITEAAALQIKDMMKEHEEENAFLRVGVKAAAAAVSHTAWALTMKSQKERHAVRTARHQCPCRFRKP